MTPFDDLELLRAFVRIVESGGISAAARSLKLPQPTLSRHLRTLEDRASTTLLLRDTHRIRLTEAGHRLLADARAMLALAEEAMDRLRGEAGELRGQLRLFATVDSGQSALSRLIARFLLLHPGLRAELAYSNRAVRMIEEGHDAGVVAGDVMDESVVARPAASLERYVVGAPRYLGRVPAAKSPADLEGYRWLALAQPQFGGSPDTLTLFGPRKVKHALPIQPVLVSEGCARPCARASACACCRSGSCTRSWPRASSCGCCRAGARPPSRSASSIAPGAPCLRACAPSSTLRRRTWPPSCSRPRSRGAGDRLDTRERKACPSLGYADGSTMLSEGQKALPRAEEEF